MIRERQGRTFISHLGTLPQVPRNLSLWGQNGSTTIKTLERRIRAPQECDASAVSSAGMAGTASAAPNLKSHRPNITYCRQKMIWTMGATLVYAIVTS